MRDTTLSLPARTSGPLPGHEPRRLDALCDAIGLPRTGYGRERQLDAFHAMALILAWQLHREQDMDLAVAGEIAAKADPDAWFPVLRAHEAGSDAFYWLTIIRTGSEPDVQILDSTQLGKLLMHELPVQALEGVVAHPLRRTVLGVVNALASKQAAPV